MSAEEIAELRAEVARLTEERDRLKRGGATLGKIVDDRGTENVHPDAWPHVAHAAALGVLEHLIAALDTSTPAIEGGGSDG